MSNLLKDIIDKMLLTESVSVNEVDSAIDKHERIIINYHSKGEDKNIGARLIEVYAYGLTKAGNECIRAWQPYGDTTSKVPSWKFFRLDRITMWKPTGQYFKKPADVYYKGLGNFNPNDDETMSVVYKIAKFGNENDEIENGVITKKDEPEVFKTDTEKGIDKLRQQLNNRINVSDLIGKNGFKKAKDFEQNKNNSTNGLVLKNKQTEPEIFKTDTERGMDKLRQQLNNPKYIKDINPNYNKEITDLRNKLGDTSEPISYKDLNQRLTQNDKQNDDSSISGPKLKQQTEPEIFKTDTEKNMDKLRQQLDNPKKIDLTKIPKK